MKKTIWSISILLLIALTSFSGCNACNRIVEERDVTMDREHAEKQSAFARLKEKADSARLFCKEQNYNLEHCILIDFSIHSGKDRFFVWDFAKDTIKYAGLCCHGYGQESTPKTPVFSNVEGSYCSSLGRYRVGARAYSQWGINVHYKMHGLDKTNSNAFKRWIVLHSHRPVPEQEIYPRHLPLGWSQGCPVISDEVMTKVDVLLKKAKKPVLMWIYV